MRTCENQSLTITCTNMVIRINSANYGRTAGSEICSGPIYTTNCYASNSLSIVQSRCQGLTSCTITASNSVFGDPCVGTYKYLEVDYTCVGMVVIHIEGESGQCSGAGPGFSWGGGGRAKDYVPARTLRARNRTHFRQGSSASLKGPGSSRVVLMLSRAI